LSVLLGARVPVRTRSQREVLDGAVKSIAIQQGGADIESVAVQRRLRVWPQPLSDDAVQKRKPSKNVRTNLKG
jgi:hypothetical protein